MAIPPGWTDDMNVLLPPGKTVREIVEFVIQAALRGTPDDTTEQLLVAEFQLSPDDAGLIRDRTFGGIVRAATQNTANCPDPDKDPMAWQSFQLATSDPSIVARIYPQFARKTVTVREMISTLLWSPGHLLRKLKESAVNRRGLNRAKKCEQHLTELVRAGRYVEAMKDYRESTGASLEDTKTWVETIRRTKG